MQATPMLLRDAEIPPQADRHFQWFDAEGVQDLDAGNAHWVYCIPAALLEQSVWKLLRVRLAQSRRWFVVYGSGTSSLAIVTALRDGAFDFIFSGDPSGRWAEAMEQAAHSQKLWLQLYGSRAVQPNRTLVGKSASMHSLVQSIERVGPTPTNVLIVGESGTGKERVAKALHEASGLSGPFLPINCAAIPRDLLESELFGVEKGAFTGAGQSREGLVEQAAGGTLFLDEIGELDISLQPKLLRFLESRLARRVGGKSEYTVEARILSATNRDLEKQIERDAFRADLFYRLSEMVITVAPLRTHSEDIPSLAAHFLDEANEKLGKNFASVEPTLLSAMMDYSWPGNVRELRAAIHRLAILHDGPVIRREWWEEPVPSQPRPLSPAPPVPLESPQALPQYALPQNGLNRRQKWERACQLLNESGHDQTWVAAQLGIHPTTLFRWIKSGKVTIPPGKDSAPLP